MILAQINYPDGYNRFVDGYMVIPTNRLLTTLKEYYRLNNYAMTFTWKRNNKYNWLVEIY